MGIIYLVKMGDTDYHKIGISSCVNLSSRLAALQTSSPYELHILRSVEVSNVRSLEQDLHIQLRQYHARGEWFLWATDEIQSLFDLFIGTALADQMIFDADPSDIEEKRAKRRPVRQTDEEVVARLRVLRAAGKTRKQVRAEIKYTFNNALWVLAGRPVPDRSEKV